MLESISTLRTNRFTAVHMIDENKRNLRIGFKNNQPQESDRHAAICNYILTTLEDIK